MTDEADKPDEIDGNSDAPKAGGLPSAVFGAGLKIPDYSVFNATVERLAKRLGVEPHTSTGPVTCVVSGEDGRSYAVLDLAHALLDRMDEAAK